MNRLFPSLCIERPPASRCEMFADMTRRRLEFPKPDIQIPKGGKELKRGRGNCRWQDEKRTVCKETVTGGLHEALAPVTEFSLDGGEAEAFECQRRKILRRIGPPPRHEQNIRPAKSIQRKLTPAGVVTHRKFVVFRFQIRSLEFRDKIRFPTLRRTRGREVAPGVVAPEFHGFGTGYWVSHTSGSGAWDGATFCDRG